jgi:hypothetical protein
LSNSSLLHDRRFSLLSNSSLLDDLNYSEETCGEYSVSSGHCFCRILSYGWGQMTGKPKTLSSCTVNRTTNPPSLVAGKTYCEVGMRTCTKSLHCCPPF